EGDRNNSLLFTAMSTTGCSAIALSRKLILLRRNHRDLGKVPRLLIGDWTV
ncbi:twitching motility protein PilT, partial [Nostoc sp. 'Peltigera malacea cyanobiont' DB3992]